MKRTILGCTMVVVAVALFAPAAQALPTLTVNESKLAISQHALKSQGVYYFGGDIRNCSRLASNRIRCSVRATVENPKVKVCRGRVEVVERAEIKVRTLRMKCRKVAVTFLTFERARQAAARAMDPKAFHPNYSMGYGGGSFGKNRYRIEATWVTEGDQICLQTAKVQLDNKKVLVNVSEIVCVDEPAWPKS